MAKKTPKAHYEQELKRLESRLDELLDVCARLREENRSLRTQQDSVLAERAQLLQRNEQARTRVESMISRLKGMENSP
jgi:cell division protein ZapB